MNEIKMHKAPRRWPLVLIAIDKFVKGIALLVISIFLTAGWKDALQGWIDDAQANPHNWLVMDALHRLEELMGVQPRTLHLVRVCVILYAGLYLIEGVGLLYEKKWAEWMVVIGTAAFLPLEIIDFCRHPRVGIVIVFLLNLLMAIYLLWRMHRQKIVKLEREAMHAFPVEASKENPTA